MRLSKRKLKRMGDCGLASVTTSMSGLGETLFFSFILLITTVQPVRIATPSTKGVNSSTTEEGKPKLPRASNSGSLFVVCVDTIIRTTPHSHTCSTKLEPALIGSEIEMDSRRMAIASSVLPLCGARWPAKPSGISTRMVRPAKVAEATLVSGHIYADLHGRKRQRLCAPPEKHGSLPVIERSLSDGCISRKRRRRVQIHKKEIAASHPPSPHSVLDEKQDLWYSQEDFTSTIATMKQTCKNMKETSDASLPVYGETLASTYLACCLDTNSSSTEIPHTITPGQMERLGIGRGDQRGMETCVLPRLAFERNQKRREVIRNVVLLGHTLRGSTDSAEFLRSLAEEMSLPSRKFAQAMGLSDTLSAVAAYSEETPQPDP